MTAYYNEIDPFAAQWLRNLIAAGHIAPGDVDERSIEDVQPGDLVGYTQCHFFAGIGVWSHALRRAGWSDSRPVWTGSCPCQSFSAAGSGRGFDDRRHLWPHFFRLISEQRPGTVFGEQVASKDGLAWLDFVCADMEGAGYAIAPVDLCAAGFGAPHIRQRLYFVADTNEIRLQRKLARESNASVGRDAQSVEGFKGLLPLGELADSERTEWGQARERKDVPRGWQQAAAESGGNRTVSVLGNPGGTGSPELRGRRVESTGLAAPSFWSDCEWLPCRDGKARPVESGTFPLVDRATNRVGRLRGYGNAIVAPVAQGFIEAYMECQP